MAKRIRRSLSVGALLEIILMLLAIAGAFPDSFLKWWLTPADFIESLLRIHSYDGFVALVIGTLIFAVLILPFDLILISSNRLADTDPDRSANAVH